MPDVRTFQEKPGKHWAMIPPEDIDGFNGVFDAIDKRNAFVNRNIPANMPRIPRVRRVISSRTFQDVLKYTILGLAHTPALAQARAEEAFNNPRLSYGRLYDRSFVEPAYKAGPLAVLAYTARNDSHPEEWLVESFVGEDVAPTEERLLPMRFPTVFGVDMRDEATLSLAMDKWYPVQ